MKKQGLLIIVLMFLSVIMFLLFTKAANNDDLLKLCEEKYLNFLWMVDGAFNKAEFVVNNKKLNSKDKVFTCKYQNNECIGNNFESEFKKLFARNITYEKVYSDGISYSWINYKNGKYYFNNINTCNVNRMSLNQKLDVTKIEDKKIVYEITIDNRKRDFVLIYEEDDWKINTAFYHDLCGMKYFIY
jgi:hypothetical protein